MEFVNVRCLATVAEWPGPLFFEIGDVMHLTAVLPERVFVLKSTVAWLAMKCGIMDTGQVLVSGHNQIVPS